MISFTEKQFKSILNKHKTVDSWFWSRYSINPYNGCQFGCIYCDARSDKYHLPTDFENNIVVKKQPEVLLDERLTRARTLRPDVVVLGGTTDPYQPAERTHRNTRNLLEVLARHLYPAHVITKSRLVAEDAALLERIAEDTWAAVSITISSANETTARLLDYRAPSPLGRFQTIEALKKQAPSVKAGVLAIPIVPAIADKPKELETLVKQSKDSGADYLLFSPGLTLRDSQALWFLKHIKEQMPEAMPALERLYQFEYNPESYTGNHVPNNEYHHRIAQTMLELLTKHDLAYRIPRWLPNDFRKHNYRLAERFLNNAYYCQIQNRPNQDLGWAAKLLHDLPGSITQLPPEQLAEHFQSISPRADKYLAKWIGDLNP